MASTPNDQQHQKTPFIVVGIIGALIAVFGVFALTLQKDFGTFVAFVVVMVIAMFLSLAAYRFFISSWLKFADMKVKQAGEQHQHERLMLEMQYKYNSPQQIAAPQAQPAISGKYTDPARDKAIRLLSATIDSKKYGANGNQVMTQADAGEIGIIANDWSEAVGYLCSNYDVLTIAGKGTKTTGDKTIGRIMADVAVMSLPGVTR